MWTTREHFPGRGWYVVTEMATVEGRWLRRVRRLGAAGEELFATGALSDPGEAREAFDNAVLDGAGLAR